MCVPRIINVVTLLLLLFVYLNTVGYAYNYEYNFTPLPWLQCYFVSQRESVRQWSLEAQVLPSSARAGN
jgi:hypothetical protein